MLYHFSWNEYLLCAAILTGGYYLLIVLLFFKRTVAASIGRVLHLRRKNDSGALLPDIDELQTATETITGILEAGKEAGKAELLLRIKPILASYDGLRLPAYRVALYNHIISKAEIICGVRISEADLDDA